VKINNHQILIDLLKKTNSNILVEINQRIDLAGFLPRSCFEVKAKHPSAQSGVYSIDPDGQIGRCQPIHVYCDMTTRNNSLFIIYIPTM